MLNDLRPSDNRDFLTQRCRLTACSGLMKCCEYSERTRFRNNAEIIMEIIGEQAPRLSCARWHSFTLASFTKNNVRDIRNSDFENLCVLFIYYLHTQNVKIVPIST